MTARARVVEVLVLAFTVALLAGCTPAVDRHASSAVGPGTRGPVQAVAQASTTGVAPPAATHSATNPPPSSAPPAVARTAPPNPCASNTAAQLVRVSLRAQHLWMCAHHDLVRDSPVTTGIVGEYTSTPTGNYTIQSRNRNAVLTLNTGQQFDVKYWIPFDAPLFGFHDAPWQDFPYGSAKYRTHGSHGCVHVPLAAIAFLYRWARVGTSVHIRA